MALSEPVAGPRLPPGGRVTLPGRGRPWVWDTGPHDSGATVVLVHGWTSTAALTWQCCMSPLAERFRVVAPDQRGHGRGIAGRPPFRLEDCADDLAALLRTLATGPVIVVGYSMGGPIAQLLWRRHRDVVAGLVLCATATSFGRNPVSATVVGNTAFGLALVASTVPGPLRSAAMRRLTRSASPAATSPETGWLARERAEMDPAGLLGAGAALLRFDSASWIDQVDVPTGVIVTSEDRTVFPDRQRRLAAIIPGAFDLTVTGGHRACVEQAGQFVPRLVEACDRVATAAP